MVKLLAARFFEDGRPLEIVKSRLSLYDISLQHAL